MSYPLRTSHHLSLTTFLGNVIEMLQMRKMKHRELRLRNHELVFGVNFILSAILLQGFKKLQVMWPHYWVCYFLPFSAVWYHMCSVVTSLLPAGIWVCTMWFTNAEVTMRENDWLVFEPKFGDTKVCTIYCFPILLWMARGIRILYLSITVNVYYYFGLV